MSMPVKKSETAVIDSDDVRPTKKEVNRKSSRMVSRVRNVQEFPFRGNRTLFFFDVKYTDKHVSRKMLVVEHCKA